MRVDSITGWGRGIRAASDPVARACEPSLGRKLQLAPVEAVGVGVAHGD